MKHLIQEWRRIAKAQMEGANDDDLEGLYSAAVDARVASRIYTRCADDLEKAIAVKATPTGDEKRAKRMREFRAMIIEADKDCIKRGWPIMLPTNCHYTDEINQIRQELYGPTGLPPEPHPPRTGEGV